MLFGGEPTVNSTVRGLAPPRGSPHVPDGAGRGTQGEEAGQLTSSANEEACLQTSIYKDPILNHKKHGNSGHCLRHKGLLSVRGPHPCPSASLCSGCLCCPGMAADPA